jgi:methylphosphotriester-DNA--protein-cysteine methyltransferase
VTPNGQPPETDAAGEVFRPYFEHFSRFFKNRVGVTASEYRRAHRGG